MFRVFLQSLPSLADWATRPWIDAWREDWLPDLERTVATAAARLDDTRTPASVPDLIAAIDGLLRATGRYFNAIALVAGVGYKTEVPLAQFFHRHVRPRSGGSHQDLLVGLGALESVRAHAVTSLDWAHPTLDAAAVAEALRVAEERREWLDRRRDAAETRALGSLKGRRRRERCVGFRRARGRPRGRRASCGVPRSSPAWSKGKC